MQTYKQNLHVRLQNLHVRLKQQIFNVNALLLL